MLHHELPWYVGGPVLGLCAIALRMLLNGRLGVTDAYTDVIDNASGAGGVVAGMVLAQRVRASAGERVGGEQVDALGRGGRGRDAAPGAQAA